MEILILDFGSVKKTEGKLLEGAVMAETLAVPVEEISADIFRIEETIFSSGGRRGGGSWSQLKPDTIRRKGGIKILRDTDALYESVTEPGAAFQILDVTNEGLVFGTDRPWAFVQQEGSAYNNRPARPFIRFLPTDVTRWTGIIMNHLLKPFRG